MKIGILQCGHAMPEVMAEHGDYTDWFQTLLAGRGLGFTTYDVVDMEFPKDIHAQDGWLLTGSRHGAYENHPFIAPLEDFIRDTFTASIPMVGICFGHQIIAQALGGKVEKYKGGWAVGHQTYESEALGDIALNAWHQDQVVTPPDGAKTIAGNDFCTHAALLYDERAMTIQPHPEFSNTVVTEYVRLRRDGGVKYPDAIMDAALAKKDAATDDVLIADRIANFFTYVREDKNV